MLFKGIKVFHFFWHYYDYEAQVEHFDICIEFLNKDVIQRVKAGRGAPLQFSFKQEKDRDLPFKNLEHKYTICSFKTKFKDKILFPLTFFLNKFFHLYKM